MSRFPPKREHTDNKPLLSYVPHGYDETVWRRFETPEELAKVAEFRKTFLKDDAEKIKFIVLYDSRNIRRKQTSDLILAYDRFLKMLPKKNQEHCRLWLHTEVRDPDGTDLQAVLDELAPNVKAIFTGSKLAIHDLVVLYNSCDVLANVSSAEGFGLGVLSALLSERMVIANTIGGLQDMMGFKDEYGDYLNVDKHFSYEWGSNADKKYRDHGEWCIPVFPSNRSLIGSLPTPFIYESRCDQKDVANAIYDVYQMHPEERQRRGKLGREFALQKNIGMTGAHMAERMINSIDELFETYKPVKKFGVYVP